MPKRTTSFRSWLGAKLADPGIAANYLNAARRESSDMFLKALRRVAESHQMTKVAANAGVSRESLYRMTCETGNPTHSSFEGILRALGLDYEIIPLASKSASEPKVMIVAAKASGGQVGGGTLAGINIDALIGASRSAKPRIGVAGEFVDWSSGNESTWIDVDPVSAANNSGYLHACGMLGGNTNSVGRGLDFMNATVKPGNTPRVWLTPQTAVGEVALEPTK
jgi:probable addiction module antidote protein